MNGKEYGFFWNAELNGAEYDREYDADSFSDLLKKFFTTGVFNGDLITTATNGMGINISSGYANIKGKGRFFETDTNFTIAAANSTYPRIDTVVVRCDYTNRQIILDTVMGTYSGSNPVATAPTRTAAVYEIVIAEIYVDAGATSITNENITDTRENKTVCGYVTGTVSQADFSMFKNQFDAWFANIKNVLDSNTAAHLQNEIDALTTRVVALEGSMTTAQSDITALNQSLTNISVYVGSDKKLHFVDKDGADSVLPFSSGLSEYACGQISVSVTNGLSTFTINYGKTFSQTPTVLCSTQHGHSIAGFAPNGTLGLSSANMYSYGTRAMTDTVNWFAYVPQS